MGQQLSTQSLQGVMVEATAAAIAGLSDLHTLELVNCSHLTSECLFYFSLLTGQPPVVILLTASPIPSLPLQLKLVLLEGRNSQSLIHCDVF